MPQGIKICGKWPYSVQKCKGYTDQWTGARNTTYAVMATLLRGVLIAISIPIFTSQLEKAREATDEANIRSAYAEISADAITGETISTAKDEGKNKINASKAVGGVTTYTATATLTQKQDNWQSTEPQIGGLTASGLPKASGTATVTVNSNGTVNTVEYK